MIETVAEFGKQGEAARLSIEPDDGLDVLADRRRPGRTEVSPALVPLLRGQPAPMVMLDIVNDASLLESDWDTVDTLRPARGIAYGVMLSLPLWAALLATCHVAIRMITRS